MAGMDQIFTKENMLCSWQKLMSKRIKKRYHGLELKAFSEHLEENIDILIGQLHSRGYETKTGKLVSSTKKIVQLSIEDMIVSDLIQGYLTEKVTHKISGNSYAYEKNKSIFMAVDNMKNAIANKDLHSFIRLDIDNFFGSIDRERLWRQLEDLELETEAILVLRKLMNVRFVEAGKLSHMTNGLIKGNPVSPILSNIYMMELDDFFGHSYTYSRYSDDMLFLLSETDENEIEKAYHQILEKLGEWGLVVNCKKTSWGMITDGVDYLGCRIQSLKDNELQTALSILLNKIEINKMDKYINSPFLYEVASIFKKSLEISLEEDNRNNILLQLENLADQWVWKNKYLLAEKTLDLIRLYQSNNPIEKVIQTDFDQWAQLFDLKHRKVYVGNIKGGFKNYELIGSNLTFVDFCKHIEKKEGLACQIIKRGKCKYVVYDVDIDKRVILEHGDQAEIMRNMMKKALTVTKNIQEQLKCVDIISHIETSGYKGYHCWVFFEEDINLDMARVLHNYVNSRLNKPTGINIESLPTMEEDDEELIKLPYTWNEISLNRTAFLDGFDKEIIMSKEALKSITMNEVSVLDNIHEPIELTSDTDSDDMKHNVIKCVDDFPDYIKTVCENCFLIKSIVDKAELERYLNHFERNALLYIFGHLGIEGINCLHYIIGRCINYDSVVTDGFIEKIKEYPVSCQKLKTRFNEYALKCTCEFEDHPLFYPSPVIFAYRVNPTCVTPPDYVEHQKRVNEIIAVQHTYRVNELTHQLMELSKKQQEIDKKLKACKSELGKIFEQQGFVHMDTEYGRLVQINGEWLVKIRM